MSTAEARGLGQCFSLGGIGNVYPAIPPVEIIYYTPSQALGLSVSPCPGDFAVWVR